MKIGQRIKDNRLYKGLTQAELASLTGYKRATISTIEADQIDLPLSKVELFADVLGVSIQELLELPEKEPSFKATFPERRMLEKFRQLDKEQQQFVLYLLDREFSRTEVK